MLGTTTGASGGAIRIEPAGVADSAAVHAVHGRAVRELCSGRYEPELIDGWLHGRVPEAYLAPIRSGAMFVARVGFRLTGFGEAAPGEILAVYVDPELGGRGVGAALLSHAILRAGLDSDGVLRLESTLNAVGFHERHGFDAIGPATARRGGTDVPAVRMVGKATRGTA